MKNGSMFSCIINYKSQDYYEKYPKLLPLTPEQNYVIALFSGYVTGTKTSSWQFAFSDLSEYGEWLEWAKGKSSFSSDVQVGSEDGIATLTTCSYEFKDARYVVLGKLIPQ